jgi:hypothetical protein
METIHFKTVDPVSQELLRRASRMGIGLNWERYEKQQPQDGFLRLGLSCPYGCLQGPCRIDPFSRGVECGICGLDRDGMVAALLLRLSLQGLLEILPADPDGNSAQIEWPASLHDKAATAVKKLGGAPLSSAAISESALLLARPSASPERLVRQALRLTLFGTGVAAQARIKPSAGSMPCSIGCGLLAGEAVIVGVTGRVPQPLIEALLEKVAALQKPEVRMVSLGDWIPTASGFLPICCTSGESETILSSGRVNLVVAGPQTNPGLMALCAGMKIPVASSGENPDALEILQKARDAFNRRSPIPFDFDPALVGAGRVNLGDAEIAAALQEGSPTKIALLGGSDSLLLSLGHLPVEMAKTLLAEDYAVASWGDAAAWMVKQDLPVALLDAEEGPLAGVSALASVGKLSLLKGVCFFGLGNCRELTLALGLAVLGMKVSLATPVPLWGSEKVRTILREELAELDGHLTHFDHPAKADEILNWFLRS